MILILLSIVRKEVKDMEEVEWLNEIKYIIFIQILAKWWNQQTLQRCWAAIGFSSSESLWPSPLVCPSCPLCYPGINTELGSTHRQQHIHRQSSRVICVLIGHFLFWWTKPYKHKDLKTLRVKFWTISR
jgi:hypothetical protein